ncbi:hypothetical protein MJ389_03610 [Escherichia coli]|nr:hypothetical protein MJ389_03610 [Escherichia coli]
MMGLSYPAAEETGGMMRHLRNIFNLGIKELRSLLGDKAMLTLIVFSFTVSVYSSATVTRGSLSTSRRSPLPIWINRSYQTRIVNSFLSSRGFLPAGDDHRR